MSRNYLSLNDELRKGDYLISNNREYKAIFQDDGNFVVYGWKPLWASNTGGIKEVNRLVMQNDCNLVIYTATKPVWATETPRSKVNICRLSLHNDGILTVDNDGDVVWKSTKSS